MAHVAAAAQLLSLTSGVQRNADVRLYLRRRNDLLVQHRLQAHYLGPSHTMRVWLS
jgi:hypothetical protein